MNLNTIMAKICTKCKHPKSLNEFQSNKRSPDLKHCWCKACCSEYKRTRYLQKEIREQNSKYNKQWYKSNPQYKATLSERRLERRKRVLQKYGNKCACCGETNWEFLIIDHIKGGGSKERRETHLDIYIKLDPVPPMLDIYRVLCANCNTSYGHYHRCPHQIT